VFYTLYEVHIASFLLVRNGPHRGLKELLL
jgi:hypothetical protein